jgi:hypothetical protein
MASPLAAFATDPQDNVDRARESAYTTYVLVRCCVEPFIDNFAVSTRTGPTPSPYAPQPPQPGQSTHFCSVTSVTCSPELRTTVGGIPVHQQLSALRQDSPYGLTTAMTRLKISHLPVFATVPASATPSVHHAQSLITHRAIPTSNPTVPVRWVATRVVIAF